MAEKRIDNSGICPICQQNEKAPVEKGKHSKVTHREMCMECIRKALAAARAMLQGGSVYEEPFD